MLSMNCSHPNAHTVPHIAFRVGMGPGAGALLGFTELIMLVALMQDKSSVAILGLENVFDVRAYFDAPFLAAKECRKDVHLQRVGMLLGEISEVLPVPRYGKAL